MEGKEFKPVTYPLYLKSYGGMYWRIAEPGKYSVVKAQIMTYSKYYSFMKTECTPGQTEHIINDLDLNPSNEAEYMIALQEYTDYAAEIAKNLPKQKTEEQQ